MSWGIVGSAAGYLGLFLFGLHFMSRQLSSAADPALQKLLARVAGKPWSAFLAGCLVTGLLQSSSLTAVMVVGLVNARVMGLAQGIAVIIGANVGTTVTAQLLSFNLHRLALPLIGASVLLYLLPLPRARPAFAAAVGFGLVMLGLDGMAQSLAPLQDTPLVMLMLAAAGEAPWQGLGGGIVTSIVLQSSSAVMGLVLSLALKGMVTLPAAVAVLIGADLGTCVTALVASLGMGCTARAAAWSHLLFNLISLFLALLFFPQLLWLASVTATALPRQLANFHTLYNLLGAIVLLPLSPLIARLLQGKQP